MTKKLQPSLSLRSLLFGGPHLEFTITLPMEECIRRLQQINEQEQLGDFTCRLHTLDDRGAVVRWVLDTGMDTYIRGEFALQSDEHIRLKVRIGSAIRGIYLFGLFLGAMMLLIAMLWLTTNLLFRLLIDVTDLIFFGGAAYLLIIVVIALFLKFALKLPRPVTDDFRQEASLALRTLFTSPSTATI